MTNEELVAEYQRTKDKSIIEKLWLQNIGMVNKICDSRECLGNPFDDLKQEAFFPFLQAVEKYDSDKGMFSTHLQNMIQWHFNRYCSGITSGFYVSFGLISHYQSYRKLLRNNPDISITEASEKLGIAEDRLKAVLDAYKRIGNCISTATPYREDEGKGYTLEDFIPSDFCLEDEVTEDVGREQAQKAIREILESMDAKTQELLKERYYDNLTLQEMSDKRNKSKQSIDQLIKRKLERLSKSQKLRKIAVDIYGYEDRYTRAYARKGVGSFQRTNTSIVEDVAMKHLCPYEDLEEVV